MEKKYFSNEGRINRRVFFFRTVVHLLPIVLLGSYFRKVCKLLNIESIKLNAFSYPFQSAWSVLVLLVVLISVSWAIQAMKRLHDLDMPGSLVFILFLPLLIPFIGLYIVMGFLIYFMLKPGTKGKNAFG